MLLQSVRSFLECDIIEVVGKYEIGKFIYPDLARQRIYVRANQLEYESTSISLLYSALVDTSPLGVQ